MVPTATEKRTVAKEEVEGPLCGGDKEDPLIGDWTCHLSSYLGFPTAILYNLEYEPNNPLLGVLCPSGDMKQEHHLFLDMSPPLTDLPP